MDTLDIPHRAALTTTTRLLSSLVTESLTRAIYLPISVNRLDVVALAVVLAAQASEKNPQNIAAYTASDVLAIAPLSHVPVFKPDGADARGGEIGILDPMDMYPAIFVVDVDAPDRGVHGEEHAELAAAIADSLSGPGWCIPRSATFRAISDPVQVWVDYADGLDLANELRADVADELASSVRWQSYSYHNPPRAPILADPSIVWEQSIVEGHPFYPMHKMRRFVPPIRNFAPGEYDLYNPKIRLVAVPRENLHITGEFEAQTRPIVDCAAKNAGEEFIVPKGHVLVPVHELQVQHIQDKFSDAKILPPQFAVLARAQQSIRSLILPSALTGTSLKLGVGIKLTSAVRTISPASAYLGPRFSAQVVPALRIDPAILRVAKELASVVHTNPDGEIAKHCAAIVRECHENGSEGRGERLIVCTSLVEYGHTGSEPGVPTVIRAFGLDTEEKRVQWLEEFVRMFFAAFFPPMLANGVGFEAHPQNTLARYSLASPPRLLGFVIRDFGGIRVHIETLRASTGVELDVVPGHSIIADSMDDVFTRMYHTAIHNHLQRLIRVLNLHYNGKGWDVVRKCFHEQVPAGHPFERAWLGAESKTVLGKCLMRMRLVGAYRHHLHGPHPNLLHYFGTEEEERRAATRGSSWEEICAVKSQSE